MDSSTAWVLVLSLAPELGREPWTFIALALFLLVALAVFLGRHSRSDWSPRQIRLAFKKLDDLDAREAPEDEYAEPLSWLRNGLHGQAAEGAVDRLADSESPSRRRYLKILQISDFSDSRGRLIAIAKDASDPLSSQVWSLLTGREPGLWKKAILASDEGAEFAPPPPPLAGPWWGYYRQLGGEHRMTMTLSFGGSAFRGEGSDGIGPFRIMGEISGHEVRFSKCYPTHAVAYVGHWVGDSIVGRWDLPVQSGEFRLWPVRSIPGA